MPTILDSYTKIPVEEFHGEDTLRDPADVEAPLGMASRNLEFIPGLIQTRRGFYGSATGKPSGSPKASLSRSVGTKSFNYYKDGTSFSYSEDNAAATATGISAGCDGNLMAPFGGRVWLSGKQVLIWKDATATAAVSMPRAFDTSEVTMGAVMVAGGDGTVGLHYAAIVLETADGFRTLPTPWIYNNFIPGGSQIAKAGYAFTYTSVNRTVNLTWTKTSGTWAPFVKAYLVMTSVANPYRYLFTGQSLALSGGTPIAFTGVSVPDGILAQQEDTSYLETQMVQDTVWPAIISTNLSEVFPQDCTGVFATQQRMVYIAGGGVFISEPGVPESMSRDEHFRRLPKGEAPLNGFVLQGTIYYSGPQFTYADTDTGGAPATWPSMRIVDNTIGMCHPNAVAANESGFAFVGHYNGLYVFDGSAYSRIPLSYFQTGTWKQIQWPTTSTPWPVFGIVDLPGERMVAVVANVGGTATTMVWDYSQGLSADRIKYSQWTLPETPIGILRNLNFGDAKQGIVAPQLWVLTSGTAGLWKRKHLSAALPFTDESATSVAPGGRFKTAYLGMSVGGGVNAFHGVRFGAEGQGTLGVKAYGLNDGRVKTMQPIPLSAAPGRFYDRLFELRSEGCAIEFTNSSNPGDYFKVSEITVFGESFANRRPGVSLP